MDDDMIHVKMPKEAAGELPALLDAVDKGKPDENALISLCEYFLANPKVCDQIGNLCEMTTNHLVVKSFPTRSTGIAIYVRLTQMRDEMGFADASELEKGLIQHVVLCWLRLHVLELKMVRLTNIDKSIAQAAWLEKCLSIGQKRYLRAATTLARVRKLLKPAPSPVLNMLVKQQLNLR